MSRRHELAPNPKEKLNEIEIEICRAIEFEIRLLYWEQKTIARKLGTSESCVSKVLNRRVNELTFNQLFRYLAVLNPRFRILISQR